MAKYVEKTVIIEAHQWFKNGDHPLDNYFPKESPDQEKEGEIVKFFRRKGLLGSALCIKCGKDYQHHGLVETLGGDYKVCPGDWIITDEKGESYYCESDIFEQNYDLVEENE